MQALRRKNPWPVNTHDVDLKLLQDFFKNHYDVSVFEKKNEEVLKTMATQCEQAKALVPTETIEESK